MMGILIVQKLVNHSKRYSCLSSEIKMAFMMDFTTLTDLSLLYTRLPISERRFLLLHVQAIGSFHLPIVLISF